MAMVEMTAVSEGLLTFCEGPYNLERYFQLILFAKFCLIDLTINKVDEDILFIESNDANMKSFTFDRSCKYFFLSRLDL